MDQPTKWLQMKFSKGEILHKLHCIHTNYFYYYSPNLHPFDIVSSNMNRTYCTQNAITCNNTTRVYHDLSKYTLSSSTNWVIWSLKFHNNTRDIIWAFPVKCFFSKDLCCRASILNISDCINCFLICHHLQ